jgi:hypothetical protein
MPALAVYWLTRPGQAIQRRCERWSYIRCGGAACGYERWSVWRVDRGLTWKASSSSSSWQEDAHLSPRELRGPSSSGVELSYPARGPSCSHHAWYLSIRQSAQLALAGPGTLLV